MLIKNTISKHNEVLMRFSSSYKISIAALFASVLVAGCGVNTKDDEDIVHKRTVRGEPVRLDNCSLVQPFQVFVTYEEKKTPQGPVAGVEVEQIERKGDDTLKPPEGKVFVERVAHEGTIVLEPTNDDCFRERAEQRYNERVATTLEARQRYLAMKEKTRREVFSSLTANSPALLELVRKKIESEKVSCHLRGTKIIGGRKIPVFSCVSP